VRAIRKVVPPDFMVGVRSLAEDFSPQRGFDVDESLQVIRWLNECKMDYLHLASQDVRGRSWKYPSETETNLHRVRSALNPDTALIACGGVVRFEDAQFAIDEGADMVALAKTAIAVPDWPNAAGRRDYVPHAFPMTKAELAKRGVSPPFVSYLLPFKLVADA
jgi:2,4-dienoyl-CoA reductase-like NADH-dependent reductase (Old Yellow Enzyme family)